MSFPIDDNKSDNSCNQYRTPLNAIVIIYYPKFVIMLFSHFRKEIFFTKKIRISLSRLIKTNLHFCVLASATVRGTKRETEQDKTPSGQRRSDFYDAAWITQHRRS